MIRVIPFMILLLFNSCDYNRLDTVIPFNFSEVNFIEISDEWIGLGPKTKNKIILHKINSEFLGYANFSFGGTEFKEINKELDFIISPESINKFLITLSNIRVEEEIYEPKITHTDDYPYISFRLKTMDDSLIIYSESQDDYIPWGIEYHKKEYISKSKLIYSSFDNMKSYLNYNIYDEIVREALNKYYQ